jgi:hypothetical protein
MIQSRLRDVYRQPSKTKIEEEAHNIAMRFPKLKLITETEGCSDSGIFNIETTKSGATSD